MKNQLLGGIQMRKYTFEFRKKLVKQYLNGEGGFEYIAKKYPPLSSITLQTWVSQYKRLGVDSLRNTNKANAYSVKFKLDAIELYQTTDMSYREVAHYLKLKTEDLVHKWHKRYQAEGIEGLSRTRGSSPEMDKKEKKLKEQQTIKELEEKVLHLEIENAFLKELMRLQEEEKMKTDEPQE